MNNILQLKGRFETRANSTKPGSPKLPQGKSVSSEHIRALAIQCNDILKYWRENTVISGALVSVHYKHVVAKSNRLKVLLSESSKSPLDSIRGAKFVSEINEGETSETMKHVFTHFVSLIALEKTISILNDISQLVDNHFSGRVTSADTDKIVEKHIYEYELEMKKTIFLKAIVDCYYTERFDIDRVTEDISEESIVTIYQTGIETKRLLSKFGINVVEDRIIDGTTLRLRPDEIKILCDKASYLIAMSVTDFSQLTRDDVLGEYGSLTGESSVLPKPTNEPIIGVIDTLFNEDVYFSEWVEYHNMVSPDIPISKEDYYHGTAVSYIIVDGPRGNSDIDDGCGHFRVRHFGVATHSGFSSFAILKSIRDIVASNRDIKVWNLSLGSKMEIKPNFISPEAAELDRIQSEYDVLFVVAGTNKLEDDNRDMKIGSPADSLNSIVVNSVNYAGKSASYTRVGPVLSFFHKPDVSYYGGDGTVSSEKMVVCRDSLGAAYVSGTSFAAPWVSRKLAYLIEVLKLNREVAKALLIDAAAGWNRQDDVSHSIGYGIVPKRIEDIVNSTNDEIRFIMTGASDAFETYTYNLPVPVVGNSHPFYARATLAYFPSCDRNQGVDYTSTEMDIHFGRIDVKNGKAYIKSIDNNKQSEEGLVTLYEEDARKMYRKWDNVKHISEEIKERAVPRKAYSSGLWGLSVKSKERTTGKRKDALQFGVVVTLKEMNGVNRIDDFIKLCMARGWIVNRLDIENQVDLYVKAEEEIDFE